MRPPLGVPLTNNLQHLLVVEPRLLLLGRLALLNEVRQHLPILLLQLVHYLELSRSGVFMLSFISKYLAKHD